MCDLYLGALNSRATTPPSPFWTNPSITCPSNPSMVFTAGGMYSIDVILQNHDPLAGSGAARVDLWWSDPTTSFLLQAANQIGNGTQSILAAPATMDAQTTYSIGWGVPATAATTNGGHVCLAAVASSNDVMVCTVAAPSGNGMTADVTSPLVAIHNVHVNAAGPMPPPPPGPSPRPRHFPWPFFFGATNGSKQNGRTRLVARAYDPKVEADHGHLWALAGHSAVRNATGRCAKFAAPAAVHLAVGRESVLAPATTGPAQRLTHTGPVHPELAEDLVKRDWVKAAGAAAAHKEIDLMERQVQQAAVWVEPHGHEGHVYAVEVTHELLRDAGPPLVIGGLTVVFVPMCRPW